MEAEEEKKRQEAEEAERLRLEEMEKGFDKHSELAKYGGRVFDFFPDDCKFKFIFNFNSFKEISTL
jgi:hypothetical protein